jgi:carboxypeptidase Taq
VLELSRSGVLGQQAWQHARKANDFGAFRPHLERMFQLKREEAEALGYGESPYDALLEDFEPAENTANLTGILGGLRDELVPLVAAIRVSGRRPRTDVLDRHYPIPAQEAFSRRVATAVGFSFDRGRLDVSAHPFCSEMGPFDCRLTTRYSERHFPSAFFGTLHEVGHGLYEQGLREDEYGLPLGHYVSLGIHESQSRMWENLVGRSRGFWRGWYAEARQTFPEALGDVPESDFFFAVNSVEPSLIRVEADEATYNLHILIRFELEQALLSGDLPVDDLPSAWNAKYRDYLGIQPTSDADGVLQDIHWSAGLIGYFPTYSLGNMYAAQFFDRATAELGDLEADFARRESHRLLDWLQKNIHRMGQRVPASELVRKVTGRPLSHAPLIDHLKRKLGPLYGL